MIVRVPQYLHRPPQLIWFDVQEVFVLCLAYLGILTLASWTWVFVVAAAWIAIRVKRRKPRGYILHLFYRAGLFRMNHYPLPTAGKFYE